MRIMFATNHTYPPQGTGGLEVNTDALCRHLITAGHRPSVFCALRDSGPYQISRRAIAKIFAKSVLEDRACGYPVFRAKYPVASALEVATAYKPDIVVVQGWNAHELAAPFVAAGLPTVIYFHNVQRFSVDDALVQSGRLHFIANSRFTASLHPDKPILAIIPPLIERTAFRVSSSRETVLFVNPLPQKGLETALNLARHLPNVPFDFYEAWSLTDEQRTTARAAAAELVNIHWHRPVTNMAGAFGKARLVLFPSAMETWGRVASEGHISGIPTLGSDRGALIDTVGPGGLCLPFDAPLEQWIDAFHRICGDQTIYSDYCDAAERYSRRREVDVDVVTSAFTNALHAIK